MKQEMNVSVTKSNVCLHVNPLMISLCQESRKFMSRCVFIVQDCTLSGMALSSFRTFTLKELD